MEGIRLIGFGHYCPDNIVTNKDIESMVDTSDEWIVKRTGIKERRISKDEGTVDLAYKASEALKNSNLTKDDIDLIVVGTLSPDSLVPSTACRLQGLLGCKNIAAFDLSAACSGFVYSLIVASSLLKSTGKKRALVVGAEVLSRFTDWKDRSTCILFGDGAGAVIIESSEEKDGLISFCFSADGSSGDSLLAGELGFNTPFMEEETIENRYIRMEGSDVFRFAVSIIPKIVNELLEKSGESLENIKYIVPHQANSRIIDEAARRLKINKDKFFVNVDRYGNTSSASIPIALSEMNQRGLINKGDNIILAAFGGGLTWAGALIKF